MPQVQGRFIAVHNISEVDRAAWEDLGSRAIEPNPLFEPACLVPTARYLTGGREIELLVAEEDGRFYGCLPVLPVARWHRLPLRTFTTDVRRMTYLGTPLVDPSRDAEAVRKMLEALTSRRRSSGQRLLELKWLQAGGRVDEVFRQGFAELGLSVHVTESFDRPLVVRKTDRSYGAHFSSKYRGVLNRRRRQLGRELGGDVTVENCTERPGIIEAFIEMEARGYKGHAGVALTSMPGEPEYFRDMCETFASRDRLQVLSLEAAGRVVAMQLSVGGRDGLFALKTTYDESLSAFGPGVLLQLGAVEYFHDCTDAKWIDSCTYEGNELLLRIHPDRRAIVSYLVSLGGTLDGGILKALPALRSLRASARSHLDRRRKSRPAETGPTSPEADEVPHSGTPSAQD